MQIALDQQDAVLTFSGATEDHGAELVDGHQRVCDHFPEVPANIFVYHFQQAALVLWAQIYQNNTRELNCLMNIPRVRKVVTRYT